MNYHARVKVLDRFMKRALLILSTTLSCLGLAGCSWMSKDPCSGDDADLSNPACVQQSKQAYRDNETRWFCIGHLEAKDWSCASSIEEAQNKHDAISKGFAQLSRIPSQVAEPAGAFDLEPAEVNRVALLKAVPEQLAQGAHATDDKGRSVATVSKESAPEPTVFAEILSEEIDQRLVDGHFVSAHAAAKESIKNDDKQSLNNIIAQSALGLSPGGTGFTTEPSNPSAAVLETQSLAAAVDAGALTKSQPKVSNEETITLRASTREPKASPRFGAVRSPDVLSPNDLRVNKASVDAVGSEVVVKEAISPEIDRPETRLSDTVTSETGRTERLDEKNLQIEVADRGASLPAVKATPQLLLETDQDESGSISTLATTALLATPDLTALTTTATNTLTEALPAATTVLIAMTTVADMPDVQAPIAASAEPASEEVIEAISTLTELPQPALSAAIEVPQVDIEIATSELALISEQTVSAPTFLETTVAPASIEATQAILADTQGDAPKIAIEGVAAQSVIETDRPNVATITTEIVIPATEPFPAGTTLAEVYADHVNRAEQLPITLQTLGPKGAVPMPAVASAAPERRIGPKPTSVQLNRPTERSKTSITRLTQTAPLQAAPLVNAVASASKLDPVPASSSGLDYASMDSPATSGDGTYDYFMDLPSDDFAIQLKAEKNLAAIRTLATTVNLENPLVLKTQLMKRPLYVLVLDTFNDIQLASDAKQAWMVQYDNGIEPWIRTVGSLQKAMQPIGPMD